MRYYRISRVANAWEAGELYCNSTYGERTGNLHNGTEQKHVLHSGQSNVPKLLPSVADAVNRACFVKLLVDVLQTGNVSKEGNTHTGPQLNGDNDWLYVLLSTEPCYRFSYKTQGKQRTVNVSVAITRESNLPNKHGVTNKGGSIEHKGKQRSCQGRKFVDEPSKYEGHQESNRSADDGEEQGVFKDLGKNVIIEEHSKVIAQACEGGLINHIIVCKTKCDR